MIQERVIQVVSQVFNAPAEEINKDSSPETIERWDSLQHMNLVLALEEEFDVQFTDMQTIELLNVELIIITINEILNGAVKL